MGSGLQSNFGEMRDGIFAAARDFFDLLENKGVEIGGRGLGGTKSDNNKANASEADNSQHADNKMAKAINRNQLLCHSERSRGISLCFCAFRF
jgi:hypothetical protein